MNEIYEQTFPIASTEVDVFGYCRPSAFLRHFQDLATAHAELLGSDRDYLVREYHAIWMLVRVYYRLNRPLQVDEMVTVKTWQRDAGGLIVYRDFDLYVGDEYVGEGISAWVVADLDSRKMLRPSSIPRIAMAHSPGCAKERQLKLIHTPKERKTAYIKTVRLSDLDVNGHMNNTKYADVLFDALELTDLEGRFISELQLNYSMESLMGETMEVHRAEDGASCYIDGCSDNGTRKFEAILQFRPDLPAELDEAAECE